MARNLFSNSVDDSQSIPTEGRTLCLEQTIIVAGRLAALFLRAGISVGFIKDNLDIELT